MQTALIKDIVTGGDDPAVGEWIRFSAGTESVQNTLQFHGLDGATAKVEIRYPPENKVSTVYETTTDELKVAVLVGNAAGTFNEYQLRATISNVQAGTNAFVGVS